VVGELAPERVELLLRGRLGRPYLYVEECESTQLLLAANASEGAVAVAEVQSAGRGRLGRTWTAPRGTGLLFSVLLRPRVSGERLPELSLVAGRAVAEAITAVTGLAPSLKFPNDVLLDGRKTCGILAEAREGRVVLGIGVNVNQTEDELPLETQTPPTSLRLELGRRVERAELLSEILVALERRYDEWVTASAA
jgi:BirA family biotin operon repressor/biotin-[acetyl-CoA-carboxylase] ligase